MIEYDRAPYSPQALAWRMAGHNRDPKYIHAMVVRDFGRAPAVETIEHFILERHSPKVKPESAPPAQGKLLSSRAVLIEIAWFFGLTYTRLIGPDRHVRFIHARAVFNRIMHERGYSYTQIGKMLGDRDRTTIVCSVNNFGIYAKRDPRVMQAYMELRDRDAT